MTIRKFISPERLLLISVNISDLADSMIHFGVLEYKLDEIISDAEELIELAKAMKARQKTIKQ